MDVLHIWFICANIKSNELKTTEDRHNHESDIQYITKLETQNEIKRDLKESLNGRLNRRTVQSQIKH